MKADAGRTWLRRAGWLALGALLWVTLCGTLAAQTVTGTLVEEGSGRPVSGGLVRLMDASGTPAGGDLTDERGRFLIRGARPGRYTLLAERLGLENVTSPPFLLEAGRTTRVELVAIPRPIALEGIDVAGQRRCVVRPGEGLLVADLWDEARKALANQEWTEAARLLRFRVVEYTRELDSRGEMVLSEAREPYQWIQGVPVRSRPAESLVEEGFLRSGGGGTWEYFAPDAGVLLSDPFLDTHCLGLATERSEPGLVGIRFEPVGGRRVADIEGTIWLDREDARLRHLEYEYTTSPWAEARGVARGRVEFEEVEGGLWIVREWWIRMPLMVLDVSRLVRGGSGLRVEALREVGGEVTAVDAVVGSLVAGGPTGSVSGVVWDSARAEPLEGAEVRVRDARASAVSDADGRFALDGVPAGLRTVTFEHPRLDSLGVGPRDVRVDVAAGDTADALLSLPTMGSVLAALCPSGLEEGLSAVVGTVRDPGSGAPVEGASVSLTWTDYTVVAGRDVLADRSGVTVRTDARGRFRACGIPPGVRLEARASLGDREGGARERSMPRSEVVRIDLAVEGTGR